MKRILNWFGNQSIVLKLYIIFFSIIILPLLVFIIINTHNIRETVTTQSASFYGNILDQTSGYLDDKTHTVKSIIDMISGDDSIQNEHSELTNASSLALGNWLIYNYDSQILFNGYLNSYISKISLYLNNQQNNFESGALYSQMSDTLKERYRLWREDDSSYYLWITSLSLRQTQMQAKYITFLSKIPSAYKLGEVLGLMQADIPLTAVEQILDQAAVSSRAALFLVNNQNEVFAHGGEEAAALDAIALQALAALPEGQNEPLHTLSLERSTYLAGMRNIGFTDWKLLYMVPDTDYLTATTTWRNAMLTNVAIIVLAALPFLFLAVRSVTKRLLTLSDRLDRAAAGNFYGTLPSGGSDEIGHLITNFNRMITNTNDLLNERYEMGQQLKTAELHVLQEQIKPHFLYNTLDLLHWMAVEADNDKMSEVISSLSSYYRLSLSKGEDMVSLEREIAHVEAYMLIQNVRYNDQIQLQIDIPPALYSCLVPKIILQPLVENAIEHGILESDDERGVIQIVGRKVPGGILLTIHDNGVGIPPDKLDTLNNMQGTSAGYGIRNTNNRLMLHFGNEARMRFESGAGCGTTVSIYIPWAPAISGGTKNEPETAEHSSENG